MTKNRLHFRQPTMKLCRRSPRWTLNQQNQLRCREVGSKSKHRNSAQREEEHQPGSDPCCCPECMNGHPERCTDVGFHHRTSLPVKMLGFGVPQQPEPPQEPRA